MPKRLFKQWLPNDKTLKEDPQINFALGSDINEPRLWSLTRHAIARAVFIGLFCSFLPIPFQMIVAAFVAYYAKANLPLSISLVWISNPITIVPIMYSSYYIGSQLLGTEIMRFGDILSVSWLWDNIGTYWQPLLLGSFINGLTSAIIGYWVIQSLWKWSILRSWKQRQLKLKLK
ncbi:MAG: DUF2062 domain-containing protein [Pseudomonadota bacterium]